MLRGRGGGDARGGGADRNVARRLDRRGRGDHERGSCSLAAAGSGRALPLLSFAAGFIDSFTVLALFGMFVAQVTGSFVLAAAAFVTMEQGA